MLGARSSSLCYSFPSGWGYPFSLYGERRLLCKGVGYTGVYEGRFLGGRGLWVWRGSPLHVPCNPSRVAALRLLFLALFLSPPVLCALHVCRWFLLSWGAWMRAWKKQGAPLQRALLLFGYRKLGVVAVIAFFPVYSFFVEVLLS